MGNAPANESVSPEERGGNTIIGGGFAGIWLLKARGIGGQFEGMTVNLIYNMISELAS